MASQSEQNFEQYLQGIEFPAKKDELVSTAQSNNAPQHLIEHLEGLEDNVDYRSIDELAMAESFEEQATEQRES